VGRKKQDRSHVPCTGCSGPRSDPTKARCRSCASAARKAHRHRRPELHKAAQRKAYARNRERHRERARARYRENPERYKAQAETWRKNNPAKRSRIVSLHRAKRRSAGGRGVSSAQWKAILARVRGICVYCNTRRATAIDHFIPVSAGGWHDVVNVVPACKPCNSAKHAHDPVNWMALHVSQDGIIRAYAVLMWAAARWQTPTTR
jgi:5-methylcytosine-specific restriction endonuclease McrA